MANLTTRDAIRSAFGIGFLICSVPALSAEKALTFIGKGKTWQLIIGPDETRYVYGFGQSTEIWTTREVSLDTLHTMRAARATFWSTSVVTGEAVDSSMDIALTFAPEPCRDSHGRPHQFTVTLRFYDNRTISSGCGDRLP